MKINFDFHNRLEPARDHRQDLQWGFMAVTADPLWFLGRQWQMGEHQGENAASPVLIRVEYSRQPITHDPSRPGHSPGKPNGDSRPLTPAESIVEGEPDDWWTIGRRIRLGAAASRGILPTLQALPEEQQKKLWLPDLPPPYDIFSRQWDGLELFRQRQQLGIAPVLFNEVPTIRRDDHWNPAEFVYGTTFDVDGEEGALAVPHHDGGDVDWWSVEGRSLPATDQTFNSTQQPARFNYPGAPHPRWWQIEDAQVDIGGFPPDRSHFPTMLLLDLVLTHSNDWFTFYVDAQIGDVVTLRKLSIVDLFGDEFSSGDPQYQDLLKQPEDWSLFQIAGWPVGALALWPVAATPLAGEALEQVSIGVDEDSNLVWAVEERANGRMLASMEIEAPEKPELTPNPTLEAQGTKTYLYQPSTFTPHHWHPYILDEAPGITRRRFIQARLADYTSTTNGGFRLAPRPVARLLYDEKRELDDPTNPMHVIEPSAVPVQGLRLDRRYVLGRRSDGQPVLWIQRHRWPLLSPPANRLRFDVMVEAGDK
jgi:hypothetical protein